MPTSGVTTSTMTALEVVSAAAVRGRVLKEGQVCDLALFEEGRRLLSEMLKLWTLAGANLWRDDQLVVDLVSGTSTYTLTTRPMAVRNARLIIDGIERRPLAPWGRDDYDLLPSKAATGQPTCYVVDRRRAETRLILWPTPANSTWDLIVGVERVIEDVTAPGEEIDAPQEWLGAVIDNLGVRLADAMGVGQAETRALREDAARRYDLVQGHDRAGPVRFEMVT
jgi:hypothetical protein